MCDFIDLMQYGARTGPQREVAKFKEKVVLNVSTSS